VDVDESVTRRILAIESATDTLSVALLEDERLVEHHRSRARMQHAATLLPAIDATLRAAGLGLREVDALAISTGPGSFTSLRIGLATLKGLAFRREVEAVGVSTLEAMAIGAFEGTGTNPGAEVEVATLLDARRGEWYAGSYRPGPASSALLAPAVPEGLYSPDRFAAALAESCANRVLRLACAPSEDIDRALSKRGFDPLAARSDIAFEPDAEWVGRLGARRLAAGEGMPAGELTARYLRRAEAEAKRLGGPVESGAHADLGSPDDRA